MKKIFFSFILILIIVSCEKVVLMDLNKANPQIVIEGIVSNLDSGIFVNLSHTASYYDQGRSAPPISNAKVVINDNFGNVEQLLEIEEGHYTANTLLAVPNRIYHLKVEVDGDTFEASSLMKEIPILDSVTFEKTYYFDVNNQKLDTTYMAYSHFVDPTDTEDYYRVKLYAGKKQRLRKYFYLFEDFFINGDTIHYGTYGKYNEGVIARIEVINIDKNVYEYYKILGQVLNSSVNTGSTISSAPENPPSNISNGALGYFGALAIAAVDTIVQ